MEKFKWLTDWYGRWQVWQSLWPTAKLILFPVLSAAFAMGAGIFQRMPLMWIVMATALTFMGVIVGMFFVSSYSNNMTPAHKLRYINTIVATDLGAPPNRKIKRADSSTATAGVIQAYLDKTQVGVQLQNTANFPISALIELASTKMAGREPPRTKYPKQPTIIFPGNTINMVDDPIEMHSLPCGKTEGYLNMKIKYGRKGKEHFELEFRGKLEIFMRKDGFIQAISTGWDDNQINAIAPPA